MGMREGDIEELAHLLPVLLQAIKDASGLGYEALYRQLGPAMDVAPDSLKRNWLRWKTVARTVDDRGRLAHSGSLRRLVAAASRFGWMSEDQAGGGLPLLLLLEGREQAERHAHQRAALRRMSRLRASLRATIQEGREAACGDSAWLAAVCTVVGEEVARELRSRLLEGSDGENRLFAEVGDDLLSGQLTRAVKHTIQQVREAALAPLHSLGNELEQMEAQAVDEFKAMIRDADLDDGA